MFKKKKQQHIAFYVGIAIFIAFFWIMPHMIDITPAEIVGEGFGHLNDTWDVIKSALKVFTQNSKEVAASIGVLASIVYAIYHFVWK